MSEVTKDTARAYTIFCDDVRPEQGNKYSAMGIYQSVLGISEPTATLPKLVALTVVVLPTTYCGKQMTLALWNKKKVLAEASFELPPDPPGTPVREMLISLPIEAQPFETEVGDVFFVKLEIGDFSYRSLPLKVQSAEELAKAEESTIDSVEFNIPQDRSPD